MRVITIGRSSKSTICIKDPRVSRYHCQIVQYDNGALCIVDLGSTNGTYVNSQRVNGQTPLKRGDRVNLANIELNWQPYIPQTVKSNAKAWIWTTVAAAIAVSLLTTVLLLVMRTLNINSEEILYSGSEPPTRTVTLLENDVSYDVEAAEGQVIVIFDETVSHKEAVKILKKNKAKIIAQMPDVHYYLVEVPDGKENELFVGLKGLPEVDYVFPNAIQKACSVTPYVLDNFYGRHGDKVSSMIKGCTPLMDVDTFNVGSGDGLHINTYKASRYFKKIITNLGEEESAVINFSFGPSLNVKRKRPLWNDADVTDGNRSSYIYSFLNDLEVYIKIAKRFDKKDFVVTISSGNMGMKGLEAIPEALRYNISSKEYSVFERHFIIVSAKDDNKERDYPNDVSPGHYNKMVTKVDISDMTAQELHWQGTSFSSPRAAGFIVTVANSRKMKVTEVLDYARKATQLHPQHLLTMEMMNSLIDESRNINNKEMNDDKNNTVKYITTKNQVRSFYTKLNEESSFVLEDGSKGTLWVYTFGLGDLHFKINWSGNNPIDINWRLDGYGIEPNSGYVPCKYISSNQYYKFEKNKYSYSIYHEEHDFHWTASSADVRGVEITVTPRN